ncbi:MAG: terminase small subunit [Daejeonella sp.]
MTEKEITTKQELFCQEYLIDLNATQAYKRAGFTSANDNVAAVEGHKLLRNPKVSARIAELMKEREEALLVDRYFVVQQLIEINQRCMAKVTPIMEYDPEEKAMVNKRDEKGNIMYEFDSSGANRSAELLGKHLGIFEKDNRRTIDQSITVLEVLPFGTQLPQVNSEKDVSLD